MGACLGEVGGEDEDVEMDEVGVSRENENVKMEVEVVRREDAGMKRQGEVMRSEEEGVKRRGEVVRSGEDAPDLSLESFHATLKDLGLIVVDERSGGGPGFAEGSYTFGMGPELPAQQDPFAAGDPGDDGAQKSGCVDWCYPDEDVYGAGSTAPGERTLPMRTKMLEGDQRTADEDSSSESEGVFEDSHDAGTELTVPDPLAFPHLGAAGTAHTVAGDATEGQADGSVMGDAVGSRPMSI